MSTTFKDKDVKIRKQQRCYSCCRKFPVGAILNYCAYEYQGDFGAVYTCKTCQEIMKLQEPDEEGGYPEFFVSEQLCGGMTPEQLLERLKTETKN